MEAALSYHRQAIELLTEVGAQCDLATAHLHLAMTLSHQHNAAAEAELKTAIGLFESIPAPQQVTRAKQFDGHTPHPSKFDGRCL
jgi:hypothetical protein